MNDTELVVRTEADLEALDPHRTRTVSGGSIETFTYTWYVHDTREFYTVTAQRVTPGITGNRLRCRQYMYQAVNSSTGAVGYFCSDGVRALWFGPGFEPVTVFADMLKQIV